MKPRRLPLLRNAPRPPLERGAPLRVTRHAIERYQQRVEPGRSYEGARRRLEQMVGLGRTRSTPRHWMRGKVAPTPGLRFLYWSQLPNVCALLKDGVVITIVTRSMFSGPHSSTAAPAGRLPQTDVSPWRWDGRIADDHEAA